MRHLEFDDNNRGIRLRFAGVEINLGSIGKGYAIDRAAEVLAAAGVENFLLHGGNSSVLARGTAAADSSKSQATDGWWIGLRHPLELERRIGEIRLFNRALGTSGSGTQFFMHEGRRYGHILDPRTGRPSEGTLSTTVAAPTGAEADALATAFYVLGADNAVEYCRRNPGLSAVIMSPGESPDRILVTLSGLADDEIRIYSDESLSIRRILE
jgi:FAD:protein FMN transferase